MSKKLEKVLVTISNWNKLTKYKHKVFDLWSKNSSFKIQLPIKSYCLKNYHIYFGVEEDSFHNSSYLVMHLISDFNDRPEKIRQIEHCDDFIYSISLNKPLIDSSEIDEAEAERRREAWDNTENLKKWLEYNDPFNIFLIGKEDFLANHDYSAYFGMKLEPADPTSYKPDLIIENRNIDPKTYFYDLARLCPPGGDGSVFGLQELALQWK